MYFEDCLKTTEVRPGVYKKSEEQEKFIFNQNP